MSGKWSSAFLLMSMVPPVLAVPAQVAAVPAFVPKPSNVYQGFLALGGPRAEVPVGALWIDGFGPYGDSGAPDNLETVRGLTGVTIDRQLELQLTAGLLDLLGIEPGLRKQFQARFTDLSIVRVKDVARLAGPAGEPRIVEALKAGSVLVTTNSDVGLNIDRRRIGGPFAATLDSGNRRVFTIEARDMFIAMRVAVARLSRSEPELIRLEPVGDELHGSKSGLAVRVRMQAPVTGVFESSKPAFEWSLGKEAPIGSERPTYLAAATLPLPVPKADGKGGIYTSAELRLLPPCRQTKAKGCGGEWRAWLAMVGERTDDLAAIKAPRW